jgi:hypothetical protein
MTIGVAIDLATSIYVAMLRVSGLTGLVIAAWRYSFVLFILTAFRLVLGLLESLPKYRCGVMQ